MKIDHPQVYLYSYQLSKKSDTDPNSIWTWADNLQQKFNVNNNYPDNFSQANCKQSLLSKAKKFDFSSSINGSIRCCLLHDSEGILARIGCPEDDDDNRDLSLEIFKTFNPDRVLVPVNDSQWLGQTILITYKLKTLVTPSTEQFQKLADEIVQNLLGKDHAPFARSTQLFGSPIFEYSSLNSQQQIFVYALNELGEKNIRQIPQSIFELFYYRHKIIKAFIDSRKIYQKAQSFYKIVKKDIKALQQKISNVGEKRFLDLRIFNEDIKQLLKDSLTYQKTLQQLDNFDNTLAINVYNYQLKLLEISDKCHLLPEELTTFSFFADKTAPHCQRQIQGDLGYFKHGTDLINTAIASIRGIVEIEQAEIDRKLQQTLQDNEIAEKKRDRELQKTVAIVGVGIGASGVSATASPYVLPTNPGQEKFTLIPLRLQPNFELRPAHSFTIVLLFSLGFGLLGSAIAYGVIKIYSRFFPEKNARNQT